MAAVIGLFSLGVVAVMFKDAVAKQNKGPEVIKAAGSDIKAFYGSL